MGERNSVAGGDIRPAAGSERFPKYVSGAILHLDIVGFSVMSSAFATRGQRGSEDLADLLNGFFAAAVGAIIEHGGLVGGFAGDAVTAAWAERLGAPPAADRALNAAAAIAAATAGFAEHPAAAVRCRLSLAQGAFAVHSFSLSENRTLTVLMGPAIAEAVRLNDDAPSGQIAAADGYAGLLAAPFEKVVVKPGLVALTRPSDTAPPAIVEATHRPEQFDLDDTPLARAWLNLEGARFGGTFRDLTVLSADLAGGEPPDSIPIEQITRRLARFNRVVERWGGCINNCAFEEKGIVIHAIFGLPPVGPANSSVHAIEAARALAEVEEAAGGQLPIGVASGRMFFGRYGYSELPTVSAFGWESSLATRMMQAAGVGVLCDAAARTRAETKIAFVDAGEITVKGSEQPIVTARPVSRSEVATLATPLIGRERDLEELLGVLSALGEEAPPRLIQGPPGIGKTRLCRALGNRARDTGWRLAWRRLRLVDLDLPYAGLTGVLDELTRDDAGKGGLVETAEAVFAGEPLLRRLAPVLQDVVDLGLAPTAHSESLVGEARHRALERLLSHLLDHSVAGQPTLLILDDLQHLDSSSAAFLADAERRGVALRLVGTVMTEDARMPASLRSFTEHSGAQVLVLEPLADQALASLACEQLGSAGLDPDLLDFLRRQSAGNPLHASELLRLLLRNGLLEERDGITELSDENALQRLGAVPESLRDLIMARLDQLDTGERRLLQKASCFGEVVTLDDLAVVSGEPAGTVAVRLALLSARALVERPPSAGEDTFSFSHETIRSVAYEMISFAERRALHEQIATHIETDTRGARRRGLADLARHWEGAERWERAIGEYEIIAKRALRMFAHNEAISHASTALNLTNQHDIPLGAVRRAGLLAIQALGQHEKMEMRAAETLFSAALTTLGSSLPEGNAATVRSTLPALLEQLGRRMRPSRGRPPPEAERAEFVIASQVHERLAEIAYFDGNLFPVLYHTLNSLNLAERAGETSTVVAGFAALAIGFDSTGLGRLADYYIAQSIRVAEHGEKANDIAYAGLVTAVLHAARGNWSQVDTALERAATLYDELGALGRWQQTVATQVHARLTRGAIAEDDPLIRRLGASIDRKTSAQIRMWLAAAELAIALQKGRSVEQETLATAIALQDGGQLHSAELTLGDGLIAAGLMSRGRDAEAMERVAAGLDRLDRGRPTAWHLSDGIAYQALVPLLLAERDGAPAAQAAFERAERALWRYQARVPVARQKAFVLRGLETARRGQQLKAAKSFNRAESWRERLSLADDTSIFTGLGRRAGVTLERIIQPEN